MASLFRQATGRLALSALVSLGGSSQLVADDFFEAGGGQTYTRSGSTTCQTVIAAPWLAEHILTSVIVGQSVISSLWLSIGIRNGIVAGQSVVSHSFSFVREYSLSGLVSAQSGVSHSLATIKSLTGATSGQTVVQSPWNRLLGFAGTVANQSVTTVQWLYNKTVSVLTDLVSGVVALWSASDTFYGDVEAHAEVTASAYFEQGTASSQQRDFIGLHICTIARTMHFR